MARLLKMPLAFYGLDSKNPSLLEKARNYLKQLSSELEEHAIATRDAIIRKMDYKPFNKELLAALRSLPVVFQQVGDIEIPAECYVLITENLYLVYTSYLKDPEKELANLDILLTSPEYTYYLLSENHRRLQNDQPQLPLNANTVDISRRLLTEPYWAFQWVRLTGLYANNYLKDALKVVYNKREEEASAAHCYHYLTAKDQLPDEKALKIISSSPWYSFHTAFTYPKAPQEALLSPSVMSNAMWVYNWLLRLDPPPQVREQLEAKLIQSPDWLVQYIHDAHKSLPPDNARALLEKAQTVGQNRYFSPWLESYVQRYRDQVGNSPP